MTAKSRAQVEALKLAIESERQRVKSASDTTACFQRARINDPARATAARGPFGENLRLALVGQRVSIGDVDMRGPEIFISAW